MSHDHRTIARAQTHAHNNNNNNKETCSTLTPPQYCSVQTHTRQERRVEKDSVGSLSLQAAIKWSIKKNMNSVTADTHKYNL